MRVGLSKFVHTTTPLMIIREDEVWEATQQSAPGQHLVQQSLAHNTSGLLQSIHSSERDIDLKEQMFLFNEPENLLSSNPRDSKRGKQSL